MKIAEGGEGEEGREGGWDSEMSGLRVNIYKYMYCIYVAHMYSQTSLVSTPEDPPNCYSLSVVLANHID